MNETNMAIDLRSATDTVFVEANNKKNNVVYKLADRGVPRCLRDYQEFALDRAACVNGFILGHDMGTGKTFSAIKWIIERQLKIVLIACPKAVIDVWPVEIEKFKTFFPDVYTIDYKVIVLNDQGVETKASTLVREIKAAASALKPIIVVINYDSIWRAPLGMMVEGKKIVSLGILGSIKWQGVVFDEIHRIKEPSGKASTYCYHISKKIQYRLGLSGTVMPHSPLDIFGSMRAIDFSVFGQSYYQFKAKYAKYKDCGTFKKFIGMNNENELFRRIQPHIDIVHSDDVLTLPAIQHITIPVTLSKKARKAYDELYNMLYTEVEDESVTVTTALVKMLRLNQITGGILPVDNNDDGKVVVIDTAKMDALDDLMADIPEHEPIVVFTRFKHECELVLKVFEKHKRKFGELSGRKNDYKDFYNGDLDSLAVQIRSGGVGIDLVRARYCVYINTGLSLGDYKQSLKRTHRSGQSRNVFYYHIIAKNTIDEDIYKGLEGKEELVGLVINGIRDRINKKIV